jgi:hypothetical protein
VIYSDDAQFFDPHVTFDSIATVEPIGAFRMVPIKQSCVSRSWAATNEVLRLGALRISPVTKVLPACAVFERASEIAHMLTRQPPVGIQRAVRKIGEAGDFSASAAVRNGPNYTKLGNAIGAYNMDIAVVPKSQWRAH